MANYRSRLHRQSRAFGSVSVVLIVLIIIGGFILLLAPQASLKQVRQTILELLLPVYEVTAYPWRRVEAMRDNFKSYQMLENEVVHLRVENLRLNVIADEHARYKFLSERYAELLNLSLPPKMRFVTARIVADLSGPFVHTLLANVGREDGISVGQLALGSKALIGRIVSVGAHAARILLFTDLNSHLPVVVGDQRLRAIMSGDNSSMPVLEFFDKGVNFTEGDIILTSHDEGLLPLGLRVGRVVFDGDNMPRVILRQDFKKVDFIRIILTEPLTLRQHDAARQDERHK